MLWQSNFIPSIWHKSSYLITSSGMEDRLGFMHCPIHLTPHIRDEVHIRRSWWPVTEFDVGLQQDPFLNHTTIMNGGVVSLKLDYSSGIKHFYKGTITFCKMCVYWKPSRWHCIWRSIRVPSWEIQSKQWTDTWPLHLEDVAGDFWFETRSQICSVGR